MKRYAKYFLIPLLIGSLWAKDDPSVDLVNKFSSEVLVLVNNAEQSKNLDLRRNKILKIMETYCDMDAIGKFVLGTGWRAANEDQRKRFLQSFRQALAADYASQFDGNKHNQVSITRSKPGNGGGFLVIGQVQRASGPPVELQWFCRENNGQIKIYDIFVEGVSMSQTLRTEYASSLSTYKGDIEQLLANMKHQAPAK